MVMSLDRALLESLTADPTDILENGRIWLRSDQDVPRYRSSGTTKLLANTDSAQDLTSKTIYPVLHPVEAKSANYTFTDGDSVTTALVTGGSSSFDFVDGDVNTGDDTITEGTHGLLDGDAVHMTTTGFLPAGIVLNQTYFARDTATNTFKLAETVGGSAVDITAAAGGGTHTLHKGVVVTLPTAGDNSGVILRIKKVDSGTGRVVVDGEGSETIDGAPHVSLDLKDDYLVVQADGTNWAVASRTPHRMMWSGYHDTDCSFVRTSTSMGDFTADATSTFREYDNINFGVVTSYGGANALPGIVATLPVGLYYVTASLPTYLSTDSAQCALSLDDTDGYTIDRNGFRRGTGAGTNWKAVKLGGAYSVTTAGSKTIRIRGAVSAGSVTIEYNATGDWTVKWSIHKV